MNTTGKIVVGALAGAAAGALLAVLFAPDKGEETRKKVVQKGTDFNDELNDVIDDFLCSITEKFDAVKENAAEMIEKRKSQFEGVKNDIKTAANNGKFTNRS
jgi:gas vesicle protein